MKIQCPHCGVKGSADDSYNGKQVKCPKCQGVFAALIAIAEVPPKDQEPSPYILKPTEPEALISPAVIEEVAEGIEQQEDVADGTGEVEDSAWSDEDNIDILTAEAAPEIDRSQPEVKAETVVEREDVFNWTDIASEIDEEMAKGAERSKEEDGDPASLNDFFTDGAPAVHDFIAQSVGQRVEQSVEAIAPVTDAAQVVDEHPVPSVQSLDTGLPEEGQAVEKVAQVEIENQPYGMDKEQCWQCGKKDSVGVPFIAKDGRLYCSDCLPVEISEAEEEADDLPSDCISEDIGQTADAQEGSSYRFTIIGLLKEAWAQTKGVKATVWAGSAVMYLTLLILVTAGSFLLPSQINNYDGVNLTGALGRVLFQLIVNVILVIFSAGLLLIGIRKVVGEPIAWKMVFEGFSVSGKLVVATILQTLLVVIGLLLLVLPGIYLAIGYTMTVPLIVDRKMSPWQAMETSRKAIHGKWWRMFGLSIVMGLISMVSALPLGLGLIWIWPMFVVLGGVVYHSLFGIDKRAE
ncbi:MAG: hypothetical protein V2B20_09875 [Pseudomonadota bacterium]